MVNEAILKTVRFSSTEQWDVKYFFSTSIISRFPLSSIGKQTIHITQKTKLFEYPKTEFKILGISNEIGMFDAYTELGENINQPYIYVENGSLAYNPYRINVGSIGLKTERQRNEYISPAYVVFKCKETMNPEYLYILLRSAIFNRLIKENTTGSVRQTLSYEKLAKIKIPVPTIKEQNELVQNYYLLIKEAEAAKKMAKNLEDSIEQYLFDVLDMKMPDESTKKNSGILKTTKFRDLFSWGMDVNCNAVKPQEIFRSSRFTNMPLRYFCEINPATNYPDDIDDISFVPMECVSDVYGEIVELRDGGIDKSKGYTRFKENDVLWAKITPCMQNGKSAIARSLKNGYGYGSTEFHVFRAYEGVMPEYIYCFLRSKVLRRAAMSYFTGSSGQQRVGKNFLEALTFPNIPLFSNGEREVSQEMIVNHIFSIKRKIKVLYEKEDELIRKAKSIFEEAVFTK